MAASERDHALPTVAAVLALALAACGSDSPPAPAAPCEPPGQLLDDGRCLAPGVPPELCGEGFLPSGNGCEPILPAEPCRSGLMAVPGESACRDVMPCGEGKWGDIPIEPGAQHVDAAFVGGDSDGSSDKPWPTIAQAIAAARPGALVAIAAGSYAEDLVVAGKSVRLWGVCPAQVELVGSGGVLAALFVREGASGTEAHGIAIRGGADGVAVSGATGVILDRLWVHDTGDRGIDVEDPLGPTSVEIHGSLIERGREIGLYVGGAEALIAATVVRGTLPRASDQWAGRGIEISNDPATGARAKVTVRASLVEQNIDVGLVVLGSEALIEATVVRGTLPRASDQGGGRGINIQKGLETGAPSNAIVRASLVEQNHDEGIIVFGAEALIEATVVRGTLPRASDQRGGRGIVVQSDPDSGAPSNAIVRASLVAQNHDVGLLVGASEALIEATVVRGTLPRASDQEFGIGIGIQFVPETEARASATVRASLVEQNHVVGLFVSNSDAALEDVVVRDTASRQADGLYGDGVAVFAHLGPATVSLSRSFVRHNARAGLSSFGASASLEETSLSCNGFDLDGEIYMDLAFAFDDQGGNACGCPEAAGTCLVQSSSLVPPAPLEPSQ